MRSSAGRFTRFERPCSRSRNQLLAAGRSNCYAVVSGLYELVLSACATLVSLLSSHEVVRHLHAEAISGKLGSERCCDWCVENTRCSSFFPCTAGVVYVIGSVDFSVIRTSYTSSWPFACAARSQTLTALLPTDRLVPYIHLYRSVALCGARRCL